jgi:hypothetical protein
LSSSEGTLAELRVVDRSGFLVAVRNAPRTATGDRFDIASVAGATDAITVSWIAAPCESAPTLTVDGDSLEALEVLLDTGPVVGEAECPAIGALFAVALQFSGDVSPESVEGRRVDE